MLRVAIGQFTANADPVRNVQLCKRMVVQAAEQGARALFLPEASDFIRPPGSPRPSSSSHFLTELCQEVGRRALWCFVGVHETVDEAAATANRPYNSLMVIQPDGSLCAAGPYRKIHLFDVNDPASGLHLMESKSTQQGTHLSGPVVIPTTNPLMNARVGLCVVSGRAWNGLWNGMRIVF
jgi:predicted amidohydrolase